MNDLSVEYTLIGILTVAAIVLVVWLMRRGWRNRQRRQGDVAPPTPVPEAVLSAEPVAAAEGMYVSTVRGEDYLDRVAVHGLGVRGNARVEVHGTGVAVLREGSPNLFIPRRDLVAAGRGSGMSGKFVERDGLVMIGWSLAGQRVTTGFRTRSAQDRDPLLAALRDLIDPGGGGPRPHGDPGHHPDQTQDQTMENNS